MEFRTFDKINESKNREIYRDTCKASLKSELDTLFKTTFIGAVDLLDKKIGYLWGHGKAYVDLTPLEKEWREVRNHLRTMILDNGNNQLRTAHEKIEKYVVEIKPNSIPVWRAENEK